MKRWESRSRANVVKSAMAAFLIAAATLLWPAIISAGAAAQGDPSIIVTPTSVEEPGMVEVTVVGAGWPSDAAILLLPCDFPDSGSTEDVDLSTCVTDDLSTVTPSGGSFETVVTVAVGPSGLAIAATDSDQTETAVALITVVQPDPEPQPQPPDELPETGTNSGLVAVVAASMVGAGFLLAVQTRAHRAR